MKVNCDLALPRFLFFLSIIILFLSSLTVFAGEDYSFDVEEFEPRNFEWGGYAEVKWEHIDLNADGAFYKLNQYKDRHSALDRFSGALQLESLYKKDIWAFNCVLYSKASQDDMGWSDNADVFEASLSLKTTPFITVDLGKKAFKWGTGYAWNPAGFIDRSKDPNDPEEALEGYIGAGLDLIKSFGGALQTIALTTVVLPVWQDINEDFGKMNNVNLAAKLYMLYQDTDIDFVIFSGNSRSNRYGIDFSKNLASNFEVHGEFAYLTKIKQTYLSKTGAIIERERSIKKYLLGLRYLSENDITTIIEFGN